MPAIEVPTRPYCRGILQKASAQIEANDIRTIVVAALWWQYFDTVPQNFTVGGKPLTDATAPAAAISSLKTMIRKWVEDGRRVYVVLNIPTGRQFDPKNLIERSVLGVSTRGGGLPVAEIQKRHGSTTERIRSAALAAGAAVIDPMEHLCADGYCPATTADGAPIYKDDSHLRPKFVREQAHFLDQAVLP